MTRSDVREVVLRAVRRPGAGATRVAGGARPCGMHGRDAMGMTGLVSGTSTRCEAPSLFKRRATVALARRAVVPHPAADCQGARSFATDRGVLGLL